MTTKAPKLTPITGELAHTMRKKLNVNQSEFWARVGIGQSAGSRYESGRNIPRPVQMLLRIAYGSKGQADKQIAALRPAASIATNEEA